MIGSLAQSRQRSLMAKMWSVQKYGLCNPVHDTAGLKIKIKSIPDPMNGFRVIGEKYTDREISGLIKGCDIYASLHRAEGLALLPLQAMSYGKAVVATGWSGNMSYMSEEASCLVDFSLHADNNTLKKNIPDMVISDQLIFTQRVEYAEPDVDHAAALLERLVMDSALRVRKGRAAKSKYQSYSASIQALWEQKLLQ